MQELIVISLGDILDVHGQRGDERCGHSLVAVRIPELQPKEPRGGTRLPAVSVELLRE